MSFARPWQRAPLPSPFYNSNQRGVSTRSSRPAGSGTAFSTTSQDQRPGLTRHAADSLRSPLMLRLGEAHRRTHNAFN